MSERALVMYSVPVACVVDLVNGTVERVVVFDEELAPTAEYLDGSASTLDDPVLIDRAQQVADEGDWPAWQFGW